MNTSTELKAQIASTEHSINQLQEQLKKLKSKLTETTEQEKLAQFSLAKQGRCINKNAHIIRDEIRSNEFFPSGAVSDGFLEVRTSGNYLGRGLYCGRDNNVWVTVVDNLGSTVLVPKCILPKKKKK